MRSLLERPSTAIVGQYSAKLFLFLLSDGAQPLLVVVDVSVRESSPSEEGKVCEDLEDERCEAEDQLQKEFATTADWLVDRVADQQDLAADGDDEDHAAHHEHAW